MKLASFPNDQPIWATGITPTASGYLLGVVTGRRGADLRQYAVDGSLLKEIHIDSMQYIERIVLGPDGSIWLQGPRFELGEPVKIGHLTSSRDRVRGEVLRLADLDNPPARLLTGVDTLMSWRDSPWVYLRKIYSPKDQRAVEQGFWDLAQSILVRFSWQGQPQEVLDITDARVGTTALVAMPPIDERNLPFQTAPSATLTDPLALLSLPSNQLTRLAPL